MSMPLIGVVKASVIYKSGAAWSRHEVKAVSEADLKIEPGQIMGMVGESGSGKTTIGKLCLGILQPTNGKVCFDGDSPINRSNRRGQMAVVLQHPEWALNPRLQVGISVVEPLSIQGGYTKNDKEEKINEILRLVGLDESYTRRYPNELSGGQRQRVAIARALITRPRFIVFDEAVSALDVSIQTQILNLIKRLQDETGFASLFISHDLAATRYVSDHIAVMRAGEILEQAPAKHFYERPTHPYSQTLFDTIA
jgi:ABC-type glutathione transport system ATPase component